VSDILPEAWSGGVSPILSFSCNRSWPRTVRPRRRPIIVSPCSLPIRAASTVGLIWGVARLQFRLLDWMDHLGTEPAAPDDCHNVDVRRS